MKKMNIVNNLALIITSFGLVIVLLWIGIFKFTPTEAESIVELVKPSPLMGWMYKLFSVQTTSNIIGTSEILTALFLVIGFFFPKAGLVGSIMSALIFFTTCTFMFSTGGFLSKIDGIWVPSELGSFLIKDLTALGASLFLVSHYLSKFE